MRSRTASVVFALAVLLASLVSVFPALGRACTAFSVQAPEGRLLAKGFDWVTGEGWIVINERGRRRSLFLPDGGPLDSWTSRYASVSLTTVGPGFPVSGMNEAGLALEALVDLSAKPTLTPEPGKLTGLELIQYGLDRFGSVSELADFVEEAGQSPLAISLHFFACDRSGECAVIEQRRGRTHVTRKLPVQALANRRYSDELRTMQPSPLVGWLGLGGPSAGSSAERFGTVARGVEKAPPQTARGALELLEKVVMPDRTQWQIVWNLESGTLLLRQRQAGLRTLQVRLRDLDVRCDGAPRVQALVGERRAGFARWSARDSARAERLVRLQIGGQDAGARRLAAAVAAATHSSTCAPSR